MSLDLIRTVEFGGDDVVVWIWIAPNELANAGNILFVQCFPILKLFRVAALLIVK